VIRINDARGRIPGPAGEHAATLLERGTLRVKLSIPGTRRPTQSPHAQDEVYVVIRGRGTFAHDGRRDAFEAGDAIFVAAGTEHGFESFTDDLEVWVIFYAPEGGDVHRSA